MAGRTSPYALYGGTAMTATAGWWLGLWLGFRWPPLAAYLVAINVITFLLYGWDKLIAGRGWVRVPELVFHGLHLFGGTPCGWVAQKTFRHKTVKRRFRVFFWTIFTVQLAALVYFAWPT
jgi:uncharacterized membrane protein YsdA (DUF1294 family)